ncbi:MAG: slipin family protein [Capnocytophaga sp.]|nr:slipin family protein [Capnocytophaga sp.]
MFSKKYEVKPNTQGYLYRKNVFEKELMPGIYRIPDWGNTTSLIALPMVSKFLVVTNQEVLSKDNVALRFSFTVLYKIADGKIFLQNFALDEDVFSLVYQAEQQLTNIVQRHLRNRISQMESETLNEQRASLTDLKSAEMENEVARLGIVIEQVEFRDLTFPKSVQDLFAKHLEAKIRAKAELENARTAVATARALKNASDLMKDDHNIRFMQWLETLTKIADKGKHSFVIGDANPFNKGN